VKYGTVGIGEFVVVAVVTALVDQCFSGREVRLRGDPRVAASYPHRCARECDEPLKDA